LRALVVGLTLAVCPATVLGAVSGIVVDALNARAVGPLAHVSKEGDKRVAPTIAYGNATPAVILIPGVVGVRGSLNHVQPSDVGRGICFPVLACRVAEVFGSLAPASQNLATANIGPARSEPLSAGALAQPRRFSGYGTIAPDNDYFAVFPPSYVYEFHGRIVTRSAMMGEANG
jgi:hypothetical protein